MPEIVQPNLSSGELAPSLHGRVDLARYYTSLRTCRNFIVRPSGGVVNRPGSKFVDSTKFHGKVSRLIPFQFNSQQAYALEFGEFYIRIIYRGVLVLYPEGHENEGQPVEVVTLYPETALSALKTTQDSDVMTICHEDYPQQQLSRYAHDDWRIADFVAVNGPFLGVNSDVTKTLYASDITGVITLTAFSDIFNAEHVGRLMYIEQNPDEWTDRWEVQKVTTAGAKVRAGAHFYRALIPGTTGTVRPSVIEGTEKDGTGGVMWEYLHSGFGIVRITGVVTAQSATAEVLSRLPDSVQGSEEFPVTAYVWDDDQNDYYRVLCATPFAAGDLVTISGDTPIAGTHYVTEAGLDGGFQFFSIVRRFTGSYGTYPQEGVTVSRGSGGRTYKFAFQAWGGEQGYPATSGYYQQRQIFGGTPGRPHETHMSRSAGFLDFGQSNPLLDDDAISFSLNSGNIGQILHFVALKQLVALTTEGPWIITKTQSNPIPDVDSQGEGGASHIPPLKVGRQALYIEEKGSIVRALGYEFSSDSYEGKDLTITADHLFEGRSIVSWAYQKTPFRCIWMIRDDGVMLGMTYLPEQEIIGWHRHDTDGFFESVCCVPEGSEDALYVVVRRTIGGVTKRYVERFTPRSVATVDCFLVDSGLTYDGRSAGAEVTWTLSDGDEWTYQETLTFTTAAPFFSGVSDEGDYIVLTDSEGKTLRLKIINYIAPDAVTVQPSRTIPVEYRDTPSTGFDLARDTFTGLGHLEGKTVAILADGKVQPQEVVTGGAVSIQNAAVVVHVGLPITADVETLEVNAQGQSWQDRVKNINSVSLMVKDTRGLLAGPDPLHLMEARAEISGAYDSFYLESNGIVGINVLSDWSKGGRVFIRQEDPLSATILAIIPQVTVSGS